MKKYILCLFLLLYGSAFAQQDPFDSFDNFSGLMIGIVCQDTSSLIDSTEAPLYDSLNAAGFQVFKIDTTSMDYIYFDSRGWPWDTLNAVIIPFGTDSAAIDTSIAKGIADVPVFVMEPYYWSDFFTGDSTGEIVQDSLVLGNTTTGDSFINSVWNADSVQFMTQNVLMFEFTFDTFYPNGTKIARDLPGTTLDGVIAITDTLNKGVSRIQFGVANTLYFSNNQNSGWTLFNRCLSKLIGTSTDSLFVIGIPATTEGILSSADEEALIPLKNRLEINGHEVKLFELDSLSASTYDSSQSPWSDLNMVIFTSENAANEADTVDKYVASIIFANPTAAIDAGLHGSASNVAAQDSIIIINNFSRLTSAYSIQDTIKLYSSNQVMLFGTSASQSASATALGRRLSTTANVTITQSDTALHLMFPGVQFNALTQAGWDLFNYSCGWVLDAAKPFAPTDFVLTPISTDSMDADWSDNNDSEDGYSVRVYEPVDAWFSHLSANVVSDSIAPIWPPNTRIISDVAAISGTDTVFSSSGKDTSWTLAAVPPKLEVNSVSDTSLQISLNGYLFEERFDDKDYTSSPVWTVEQGTAEIDTVRRQLRITTSSPTTVMTVPFSADDDSLNDGDWYCSYKFSDSTAVGSQFIQFNFMVHKAGLLDSSGYYIEIDGDGDIDLYRRSTSGSGTSLDDSTVAVDPQDVYKWHDIRVTRAASITFLDTAITFTVYLDGNQILSATDETWFTANFMALTSANSTDTRFDNILYRQLRPSANHDSTQYVINESVSNLNVQLADTLGSSEVWENWIEHGGNSGFTLTGVPADSSISFRSKARNEY